MAETNMQAELRALQTQVTQLKDSLAKQGDKAASQLRDRTAVALNGASRKADEVAEYARAEAATVAGVMRDHPAATSTALLTVGLLGAVIGYFVGTSAQAAEDTRRRWY